MTILQAMFLMRIAAEPGVTQSTLWDEFDTFDSVASRAIAVLGSAGVRGGLKADGQRGGGGPARKRRRGPKRSPR
jgi:hypothetical protein